MDKKTLGNKLQSHLVGMLGRLTLLIIHIQLTELLHRRAWYSRCSSAERLSLEVDGPASEGVGH